MTTSACASVIFENQPKLINPDQAAELINYSRWTIYEMAYRPSKYNVPAGMFIKSGRRLLVRTDILKNWFISRISI